MNVYIKTITLILIMMASTLAAGICLAQLTVSESKQYNDDRIAVSAITDRFIAWLNLPWAGDDSQYAEMRQRITAEEKAGKLGLLLPDYRRAYLASPRDVGLTFQYYYALKAYTAGGDIPPTYEQEMDIGRFSEAFLRGTYPRTYNYTRLIVWCWCAWEDQNLLPFVMRLATKDPTDKLANGLIPTILASSDDLGKQTLAIILGNELVTKYPDSSQTRTLLGFCYLRRWAFTRDKTDAQKAIDSYNEYLALAKPNESFRPLAYYAIAYIKANLNTPKGAPLVHVQIPAPGQSVP